MELHHPTFLQIPDNATLISFGNCFRGIDNTWRISCYFKTPDNLISTSNLVIETLPALALGRIYAKGKITVPNKDVVYVALPSVAIWEKLSMRAVPSTVYSPPFHEECKNQRVYKIPLKNKILWLPVIELARLLFLKTVENSRHAFYEPNLYSMAKLDLQPGRAIIALNKRYPRKLLDSRAHQEYLAWLLLNPAVTNSFCSIYKSQVEQSTVTEKYKRWVFDFNPIELFNVTLMCYGAFNDRDWFVHEIRCIARLPTTTDYKNIIIEHPDDIKYQRTERSDVGLVESPRGKKDFNVNPDIDDRNPPSTHSKHRVMDVPKGRLYFDALLEPERHFTEVLAEQTTGGASSKIKKEDSVNLGITEGDTETKSRKTDFQALMEPKALPADFFNHIRSALQYIQETKGWAINEKTGALTHEKSKTFLNLLGTKRRYFYGEIVLLGDSTINLLEIDLSDKHGLTTLILRLPPGETEVLNRILQSLVEKSGHWNKPLINELTDMSAYIAHPKDLFLETDKRVYENWAKRIIREF